MLEFKGLGQRSHLPLTLTFIPGKLNCFLDVLSRNPCFVPSETEIVDEGKPIKVQKSSKGEIESVTLPADRACFKHKILVDEELGTVPMVLQVLTRSRRKAASESDPLRSQILNHSITKLCWLRTRYLKKALKLLGYQKTQFWKAL